MNKTEYQQRLTAITDSAYDMSSKLHAIMVELDQTEVGGNSTQWQNLYSASKAFSAAIDIIGREAEYGSVERKSAFPTDDEQSWMDHMRDASA